MTLRYLKMYYQGTGETWIIEEGVAPARKVFGAPAWMWKTAAAHGLMSVGASLSSPVPRLVHLREFWRYSGALKAIRAGRGEGVKRTS